MSDTSVVETFIKPKRTSPDSKAETTTRIAREMLDAESNHRGAKTARLRAARLAMEAKAASEAPEPAPKKTVVRRRTTAARA